MQDDTQGRPTEASIVTDRLREEIVRGEFAPGTKLKLVPLSRRYAVSRGPLREAASRLAAEGLVTIEDQRGFRVTPVSRQDLLDLTRTRQRVEVMAMQDAIAHGDLAWEGQVMASCHVLTRVTDHDGSAAGHALFAEHHHAFHQALVAACPSTYLLEFRDRLYALTERYRHLAAERYQDLRSRRDIAAEHQAIAEAAIAREASKAATLLADHLGETATMLLDTYPELFGDGEEE